MILHYFLFVDFLLFFHESLFYLSGLYSLPHLSSMSMFSLFLRIAGPYTYDQSCVQI